MALTFGSIHYKDYLDRRRAGLIGNGGPAPTVLQSSPTPSSTAAPTAPIPEAPAPQASVPPPAAAAQAPTEQSVAYAELPHREDYASGFMFTLARYKKSLIIALVGFIIGWFGAADFAAIEKNIEAGGTVGILSIIVIFIGPIILFILEKNYLVEWNYSGYVVNCFTLFMAFGAGLALNTDVGTAFGSVIVTALFGLVPSTILGAITGKIFYKPKAP